MTVSLSDPGKHVISLAILPVLSSPAPLLLGGVPASGAVKDALPGKIADKLLKVVIPLPKEILANQDGLEEALVVVMIPAAVLASAEQASKAIAINVCVPADLVLSEKDLEKLIGVNLLVPVPVDIMHRVETIIALPQVLRPQITLSRADSLSSSSAKALSIPLTHLISTPTLSELRDAHILLDIPPERLVHSDSIADKTVSLSFPFPIPHDALENSTNATGMTLDVPFPDELLDLIDKVLSVPKLPMLGEPIEANDRTLRYYDSVTSKDGASEYIQDEEWSFNQEEPITSLIDAHVLFAQEILMKMQTTPSIVVMRGPNEGSPRVAETGPAPFVTLLRPEKKTWENTGERDVLTEERLGADLSSIKPILIKKKKVKQSDWEPMAPAALKKR